MLRTVLVLMEHQADYQRVSEALTPAGFQVLSALKPSMAAAFALVAWTGDGSAARQQCRNLRQQQPGCRCVLVVPANRACVLAALPLATAGYLAHPLAPPDLLACLQALARGDGYWSELLLAVLRPQPATGELAGFNRREQELWGHLANGLTNRQIEKQMCLGASRIKNLKTDMAQKLGLPNAHGLIMHAVS